MLVGRLLEEEIEGKKILTLESISVAFHQLIVCYEQVVTTNCTE